MHAFLAGHLLSLNSANKALADTWHDLFELEIATEPATVSADSPGVCLNGHIVEKPPDPPPGPALYSEPMPHYGSNSIRYHDRPGGGTLTMARPAQVEYDFVNLRADLSLTKELLTGGHLEDLTLVAVAPLLRRLGINIIHAFSVAKNSAVLLCGKSGSGKTTTGLALVESGWSYLANDATLMAREADQYVAFGSPGTINVYHDSLAMAPSLAERLTLPKNHPIEYKYKLSRSELFNKNELAEKAPIGAVLFPTRSAAGPDCCLQEVPPAVALARMMEQDVDQWDKETYFEHLDFLTGLFRQTPSYDLFIPEGNLKEAAALVNQTFGD